MLLQLSANMLQQLSANDVLRRLKLKPQPLQEWIGFWFPLWKKQRLALMNFIFLEVLLLGGSEQKHDVTIIILAILLLQLPLLFLLLLLPLLPLLPCLLLPHLPQLPCLLLPRPLISYLYARIVVSSRAYTTRIGHARTRVVPRAVRES
jgi:hypothetical protein